MEESQYTVERTSNPDEETQKFLWGKLQEYSLSKLNREDHKTTDFFSITYSERGTIIAGALCYFYFKGLNLQLLWVDESKRGRALGTKLLAQVEEEAGKLGAKLIFLYSFGFQAPKFYLKWGYKQFGIIEDFPEGHNCYFLQKKLS
ncbi:GNAT family N-acetyltransferase [Leptospira ognonensis]|uniref:GNAT family N-acetyltransferase n=1 Tax=Leptospira ognonensis TaxID=2484945 RepID=A0A4R9K098_9LEPT|nr:GNAT family N-acetyltransferase [Leptospira ognonensis]TGL57348.1 GNAT family N-acetyltransferase [Leptospira ognonensis]